MDDERVIDLIHAFESSIQEGLALIAQDPGLVHARTSLGETPLHFLCVENRIAPVRELIKHGAIIDTVNDCGTTPLSDAASLGYAELVAFLLEHGAALKLKGQHDPTLHQAVHGGNLEVVKLILNAGADVNEQGGLSESPLHVAVEDDRLEIAKLLLAHGANPALKQIFDESALDAAERAGSESCVALLSSKH
jgi:ankyrin repeat protein